MKQSHRLFSSLLVAVAALAAAASAQAQSSNMSSSGGGFSMYTPGASYIGLNAGKSKFSLNNGVGGFGSENKDTSYNIYAGSYFNPNFGLELGYTDFGKVNRAGGTTKAEGINLSLVGKFPLSPSFNLLGKLGSTYGRTNTSSALASGIPSGRESGFGVSYGLGAEFAFTPVLSAVVQYDEHDLKFSGGSKDRVSSGTVGLRYRF